MGNDHTSESTNPNESAHSSLVCQLRYAFLMPGSYYVFMHATQPVRQGVESACLHLSMMSIVTIFQGTKLLIFIPPLLELCSLSRLASTLNIPIHPLPSSPFHFFIWNPHGDSCFSFKYGSPLLFPSCVQARRRMRKRRRWSRRMKNVCINIFYRDSCSTQAAEQHPS